VTSDNSAKTIPLLISYRNRPVNFPTRFEVARHLLIDENRAHHLDRDAVLFQNLIVKCAIGHLAGINQLVMHRVKLQAADQIRDLIKRAVTAIERSPHFGGRYSAPEDSARAK
jgi:hypothetical protein